MNYSIKLYEGQHLSDVEPFKSTGIPTNSKVHKRKTGCGATTLEIEHTEHHSIIIVPNVPVIKEKIRKHNKKHGADRQVLGVYKGIDAGHIADYISSSATYKKIITTPEGFIHKVLKVFENDLDNLYLNYFLLLDECERIVTDVSYRGKIAAPIDHFFKFNNKALVSATTLPFSHEGFSNFNHYMIEPQFDFSQELKVVTTNNVIASLEKHLETIVSEPVFIFVNSTDLIYAIVDILNIKEESNAYCSDKSVAKLFSRKFKTAYSELDLKQLAKYNFLTSRYFSALDIELDYKPDIIMITDVFTAEHSVLDPQTEAIQIPGRFRNGINSLTHITNFNAEIESKSNEEALQYLDGCFDTYRHVVSLFDNANHRGSKETLQFFVENSPIAQYFNGNKVNEFMVDNFVHEERVKAYYQSVDNLKAAYIAQPLHFKSTYESDSHILGDEDRVKRDSKQTVKEQKWETLRQIDKMSYKPGVFKFVDKTLLGNLRSLYPPLTEAYDWIGLKGLESTGLNTNKITTAVARAKRLKDLKAIEPLVHKHFIAPSIPSNADILSKMEAICLEANVSIKPTISLILSFFNGKKTTAKGINSHSLASVKNLDEANVIDESITD